MIRAAHFDLLLVPFGRFCGAFGDVLDDEPSEREAEDGSDVNEASVDEGFDGFVLVGIFLTAVLQEFVAEDAEEFSGGEVFFFFESTTQRSGKRTALHLPELGDGDARRVQFQCSTHGGEETCRGSGGVANQKCLVCQRVDGINDVVKFIEIIGIRRLCVIASVDGTHVCFRVDGQQMFAQGIHFDLSDGQGGSHELAVDVARLYFVGIDDGEVCDAGAHECLGTPTSHSSHSEENHFLLGEQGSGVIAQQAVYTGKDISFQGFERGKTKSQRDKESKSQRDEGGKSQRDKESKRRRDEETKGQRVEETKGGRVEETKGKGQETAWNFEFPRRLRDVNGGRKTPPKAVAVGGVS